jgi:RNA polymerase sigma-70 factor (ECF subfamily)
VKIDIEDFYRRFAPMVLRRCRFLMRDEELALDMMQETFANLLRHQDRLEDSAPSSLLYTMATNLCLNAIKSHQTRSRYTTSVDSSETEFGWSDPAHAMVEAREMLDQIFALDDEKTRTIAWLHYVDRLTLEETAERSGMSVSGIRKRLRKLQRIGQEYREVHT